jgi:hypothetical protein
MKTFLLLSCLLAACSPTLSGSPSLGVNFGPTRVEVSKFQPGETRDSVVEQIGEPEYVAYQENGDRREVYSVDSTAQGSFCHRNAPPMGVNTQLGPFMAIGTVAPSRLKAPEFPANRVCLLFERGRKQNFVAAG